MRFKLPSCPFCGCKMWYIEAFAHKNKPIYKCKNCKEKSAVQIKSFIFKIFWIVEVLFALIFCVSLFLSGEFAFFGLILIILIFGFFYALSPYSVKLGYPRKINKNSERVLKKCEEQGIYKEHRQDNGNEIYSN